MFVCCEFCVMSGRDLYDELITHSEENLPTVVRRCGLSRNLMNEEALAHWGFVALKTDLLQGISSKVRFTVICTSTY